MNHSPAAQAATINNEIYKSYGDRWYTAFDDPVAILRAETRAKLPWVLERIRALYGAGEISLLDVGCGGGFLSNPLAAAGLAVTGLDMAHDSLEVAARFDPSGRAKYIQGDAYHLPFAESSFQVVTQMDVLEHLENPERAVKEAARVLKPGGLFFFHTLNRNRLAWLVAIKLVEWLVANTPEDMHLLRLFIKPKELRVFCEKAGLEAQEMAGLRPKFSTIPLTSYFTGKVPASFEFKVVRSTLISYMGVARKI
jgi:2-polyprenyl-6-hydroxyphenyl methylase/3-demethylubiquinone-9 3-methyltransferase